MGDDEDYATIGGSSAFLKLANNSYGKDPNSYTQFLCYLSNIASVNDLEYIFDKDQLTNKGQSNPEAYVKGMFRELMLKPVEQQQIFDVIWGNVALRGDLWKAAEFPNITEIQAKLVYADWVKNLKNNLFNFIKVK